MLLTSGLPKTALTVPVVAATRMLYRGQGSRLAPGGEGRSVHVEDMDEVTAPGAVSDVL